MRSRFSFALNRFFDLKRRSLLRGNGMVLLSLLTAFLLSHFPNNARSLWIMIPLLCAIAGTADSLRCMQSQWGWYHGGVLLCIYMDLMAVALITFFLLYPFWL